MPTTVTDLHERLSRAGMPEEQAFAVIAAFESLDRRLGNVETRQRLHTAMLGIILAAVLTPDVGAILRLR